MDKLNPLRLGIIGAGNMTRKRHLPALAILRDEGFCVLRAICDIDIDLAQSAADTYIIDRVTHEALDLINSDDIDAVCIFAPAEVHYIYGMKALQAGKHLFVEKPPAENTKQQKDLIDAAQSKDLITASGFNRRFQKNILEIKKRIGETSVLTGEAIFDKPSAGEVPLFGMKTWVGVSAIHALDVLCFVMGERPTALWSIGNGKDSKLPENFSAIIEWGDRYATFSSNNSAGSRLERYSFHGYGQTFVSEGSKVSISHDDGDSENIEDDSDINDGIYFEFKSFFEAIIQKEKPPHSLDRTIAALRLVELIENNHRGPIDWSFIDTRREDSLVFKFPNFDIQKQSVLILNQKAIKSELSLLSKNFNLIYEDDLDFLSDKGRDNIVAIITGGPNATPPKPEYFEQFTSLKVLCVLGASVKKWGGQTAVDHDVSVINTADVYAKSAAEFIVTQALVGLRRASVSHDVIRRGGWGFSPPSFIKDLKSDAKLFAKLILPKSVKGYLKSIKPSNSPKLSGHKDLDSRTLRGKTIGIIGFGEITKETIPLFRSFDCKVLVYSEYLDKETAKDLRIQKATIGEVLLADVVSIQRGLSLRTAKVFGSREISTLRPGTVFINSARAGLVDNDALLLRLKKGDLFACLDVYEKEPLPIDDKFRKLPNVFLTSHIAGSIHHTEGLLKDSNEKLVQKLIKVIEGETRVSLESREYINNMT
jgi:phosphoglycerate dehydrogenase-like enzyme/predicted dehydrogenase